MWKLFSRNKNKINTDQPDLDKLNDSTLSCLNCGAELDLDSCIPLSIQQCPDCSDPIFVPKRVDGYWLYKPLGGGGMGSVYKAISSDYPDNHYAIKILPREKKKDQFLIDTLMRESEIGHSFGKHPNIAYVDGYGEADDEYYAAMPYIEGIRLDQLIEQEEDYIVPERVFFWILQILSAEQRIYDHGYLYRDLKPQNIIIDKDDNSHLIDFGLCMSVEEAAEGDDADSFEGSPFYVPPERIVGAPESMSSEIYSLGMVIYHAISKKTYYTHSEINQLVKKHLSSVRIASTKSKLPENIELGAGSIIDKMIARRPSERYQTFKEVQDAVKRLLKFMKKKKERNSKS